MATSPSQNWRMRAERRRPWRIQTRVDGGVALLSFRRVSRRHLSSWASSHERSPCRELCPMEAVMAMLLKL